MRMIAEGNYHRIGGFGEFFEIIWYFPDNKNHCRSLIKTQNLGPTPNFLKLQGRNLKICIFNKGPRWLLYLCQFGNTDVVQAYVLNIKSYLILNLLPPSDWFNQLYLSPVTYVIRVRTGTNIHVFWQTALLTSKTDRPQHARPNPVQCFYYCRACQRVQISECKCWTETMSGSIGSKGHSYSQGWPLAVASHGHLPQ